MSEFGHFAGTQAGGMLSRQMSTSHVTPRSLTGYQDFFRQNSNPENGWLSLRVSQTGDWDDRWVAFEDYTLSVYRSPGGAKIFDIPMDTVVSFRTDVSVGVFLALDGSKMSPCYEICRCFF